MQVHKIRGGSKKSFLNKEYNIAIGISLGNKWFTIENVIELTKFVLPYTKDFLVIYVADTLHAINIEVRNRKSKESAVTKAGKMGEEFISILKERLRDELSNEIIQKIYYKKWDDLVTESYREKLDYLYSVYESNIQLSLILNRIYVIGLFCSKYWIS